MEQIFFLLLAIFVALIVGPLGGLLLRALARIPFYFTFTPANTFCIVVTEENESGKGSEGSGNIIDVLHAVPGKRIDKSSSDVMQWKFIDGEVDPEHENYFFNKFGIQSMGNVFAHLRTNVDRRMRFTREKDKDGNLIPGPMKNVFRDEKSKHVFFSGELTVEVKQADTKDQLGLDFQIDFAFERRYPVRSVLRLADTQAFMTSRVEEAVNLHTVDLEAKAFFGGDETKANRKKLAADLQNEDFDQKILEELGLEITSVNIRDVDMTKEHRKLMEAETEAIKKGDAEVAAAERRYIVGKKDADTALYAAEKEAAGEKAKGMAQVEVDEAKFNRIIERAAKDKLTSTTFRTDRYVEGLEKLTSLRTLVTGNAAPVVPLDQED